MSEWKMKVLPMPQQADGKREDKTLQDYIAIKKQEVKMSDLWWLVRTGGAIGERSPYYIRCYGSREAAAEAAKKRNRTRTPGERGYYRIKYAVKRHTEKPDATPMGGAPRGWFRAALNARQQRENMENQ